MPVVPGEKMVDKEIIIKTRHLPHWTLKYSVYFITFTLLKGKLKDKEKDIIFNNVISGNKKFYRLHSLVVMPDHVHLILNCNEGYELSRIMKGIKGVTANLINKSRGQKGTLWLNESFDRIIRDVKEYDEKMGYIFNNPLKKGLTDNPENYKWWYFNDEPE